MLKDRKQECDLAEGSGRNLEERVSTPQGPPSLRPQSEVNQPLGLPSRVVPSAPPAPAQLT